MTDIEQKALALVNEVLAEWGVLKNAVEVPKNSDAFARALLRAIEKHEAFRQEVSDAAEHLCRFYGVPIVTDKLERFIIAKPDPLVEALHGVYFSNYGPENVRLIRAAIEENGGKIVWGEG